MKITHGFKITTANRTLCCKTLIAKLVVSIIFTLIIFSFARNVVLGILGSEELKSIFKMLPELITDVLHVDSEVNGVELAAKFKDRTQAFFNLIASMKTEIIWVCVAVFVVILIMRFFYSVCDYVVGVSVHQHMANMLHVSFFNTLVEKFKLASAYAGYRTLILTIYDVIVCSLCALVFVTTAKFLNVFAVAIVLIIACVTISLRFTILGTMLPKMICENKGVWLSVKESLKEFAFVDFLNRFAGYVLMCFFIYCTVVLTSIITISVGLLITLPICNIMTVSLRFVDYYSIKKYKYYITFDEIIIPKELRPNDENLLNNVDI